MSLQWTIDSFEQLDTDDLYAILRLRQEVFIVEQQSIYLDTDDKDQWSFHMSCWDGDVLAAYQRCLPPGVSYPESAIGRIVVAPGRRGGRLGRELVQRGIEHNLGAWPGMDICINAQSYLLDFYTSLGFEAEGDEYEEDGILHQKMRYRA
jgi:ElaA protein